MKELLKRITLTIASLAAASAFVLAPAATVGAQNITDGLNKGTCLSTTDTSCDVGDPEERIDSIITTVINVFSLVVGVVSVIMIIIGGFKYITSGGDSGGVSSAKNTILFAIVGLIIVALAQVIVRFVLGKVTDA